MNRTASDVANWLKYCSHKKKVFQLRNGKIQRMTFTKWNKHKQKFHKQIRAEVGRKWRHRNGRPRFLSFASQFARFSDLFIIVITLVIVLSLNAIDDNFISIFLPFIFIMIFSAINYKLIEIWTNFNAKHRKIKKNLIRTKSFMSAMFLCASFVFIWISHRFSHNTIEHCSTLHRSVYILISFRLFRTVYTPSFLVATKHKKKRSNFYSNIFHALRVKKNKGKYYDKWLTVRNVNSIDYFVF